MVMLGSRMGTPGAAGPGRTRAPLRLIRGRCGGGGTASLGFLERGCQGEQRVYLGVGQEVAAPRIGVLVGVELPVVGEVGTAAAEGDARGGDFSFDACVAGELYEVFGRRHGGPVIASGGGR